jgi:hypothetical protein
MDEKISLDAIAAYADAYADKISREYFSKNSKITGPEILKLTSVPQVNMFVIRELLLAWKEETQRIKSPYFDYEDAEVKQALDTLMTVLSNHIAVSKQDFAPLLRKAVRQTLLVIFNPYDFFSILVTGTDNRVEVSKFREEIKYLKINRAPIARLVEKLDEKGHKEVSGNEAFAILDQILEEVSFTPEDLDEHIRRFSETLPLDPSSFFPRQAPEFTAIQATEQQRVSIEITSEEATLNDRINVGHQHKAVYNNFQKIPKIKDHLTINQKFMFTKVLFNGDFESFSRAVDELDQMQDMGTALKYLESYSSDWDKECREFHEFMEMVEKRFG